MYRPPRPLKCGRCGEVFERHIFLPVRTVKFDDKVYDMCRPCWNVLVSWMESGTRISNIEV